jgi:hypothetical protein
MPQKIRIHAKKVLKMRVAGKLVVKNVFRHKECHTNHIRHLVNTLDSYGWHVHEWEPVRG